MMTPQQTLKVAEWLGKRDDRDLRIIIGMAQQRLYMLEGNIRESARKERANKRRLKQYATEHTK